MKYDVIIIGAGAAGLLAMRDLAKSGFHVCMLMAAGIAGDTAKILIRQYQSEKKP